MFIDDQGLLILAQWAKNGGRWIDDQHLAVDLTARDHPMYGTTATGDPLVSNGHLGVDMIRVPAGGGFAPHTHPGDHLLIVVGGRGTITYDGKIYPTSAGQVYLVEGDVPHAVGAVTDHTILAVGAPHRPVDAADRMTLTAYDAVSADLGTLTCLECDVTGKPDELADLGCPHAPCRPGTGKPIVVGLAPAHQDQPAPFTGTRSGDNLARLLDVDPSSLLAHVDTANLSARPLPRWQNVKASEWTRMADDLRPSLAGRVVVCAGKTVAEAFGVCTEFGPCVQFGSAGLIDGTPPSLAVVIPHPSGLSRSWNDDGTKERCTRALRLAVTFAKVDPPRGAWTQYDAEAFTAAAAHSSERIDLP